MPTTAPRLTDPSSIFVLGWSQTAAGKLALDVWIKPPSGDTRGVIDAALTITLDPNDATLATGNGAYTLPTGWTGLVGGASEIIVALFNSTESTTVSGQQVYVNPVFETTGEHAGMQKLVSLALDVKPLVSVVSPIQVTVDYFTDSLTWSYPAAPATGTPLVLSSFSIPVPGGATVTGTSGSDTLDASVAARALMLGLAGDDTGINLSGGDAFLGGPGVDTARFPNAASSYTVRFAAGSIEDATAQAAGTAAYDWTAPLFAVTSAGTTDPIVVQAEQFQFGGASGALVNPLRLLSTGTPIKLVASGDSTAFASIRLALAAASSGDTIVVSPSHQEPDSSPLEVAVDNLRVLLLNADADALMFRLKESASVSRFTLLGHGAADVLGNSFANVLVGNDADNRIDGGGGDDLILGMGGDDVLAGGAGQDFLDGNEGWDTVSGGAGNDVLYSDHGGDAAVAGSEAALSATDVLIGGSGADLLIAGAAAQPSTVRMMGGSGADVFRLMSVDGIDGRALSEPQGFRVHVADLTANDCIDISAILPGSVSQPELAAVSLSGRLTQASGGDLRVSLADLVIRGLQGPTDDSGVRSSAPYAATTADSVLVVSMAAGEASISAAIQRAASLQALPEAPYGRAAQDVVDAVAPTYFALDQLLNQLILDTSPNA